MEHHNTQTALHNVTDDWYYNMTDSVNTVVCSLDFQKCFDTINHKILLEKMELYGFQPGSINCFESYLTGRQQSVFCQNVLSCKRKIQIGIPQGSVLGPVLFVLYVNDINRHVSLAACSLYADDTLLYITSDTIEKLQDNLQECICEVEKWYNNNMLVINASKSNVMVITTKQKASHTCNMDMHICLGSTRLKQVGCTDYLGIKLDQHLLWNEQVDNLCKIMVFIISRFRRLKNVLNPRMMIYTVYCKINATKLGTHKVTKFRNYNKFSAAVFKKELLANDCVTDVDWHAHMLPGKWQAFKNAFIAASDKCAPFQMRRLKNRNNPWVDDNLVKLMYKRDHLKRKAIKLKDESLWLLYKQTRNCITNSIRSSKRRYYETCINRNKGNVKNLWKVLRQLTEDRQIEAPPINLTATQLNQYFSTIGSLTVSHLQTSHTIDAKEQILWKGSNCACIFNFTDVQLDVIRAHLYALGDTSNNDVLGFDSKLLFSSAGIIAPIITKFFNSSIACKVVLPDWKISKVIPIYKGKGNRNEAGNYRPISLLSHIMKIFEKQIKTQLMFYLEDNALISADQSAYRKQHNTQTALHKVIDDWFYNMSDGNLTAVCSLDIKKCFDTINHFILFKKMKFYGIHDENVKWFKSYLNDRQQVVLCQNELSEKCKIEIGVPQGSVLGPVLLMIYVNDINRHIHLGACNIYADDTLVYCTANSMPQLKDNIQKCICDIHDWYCKNQLVVNESKSNVMLVTTRQRLNRIEETRLDVYIGEFKLVQTECIDYLGMKIDENISWNA